MKITQAPLTLNPHEVPMTVAGPGGGGVTRWLYSTYGDFLNVYGIRSHISMTFNTTSASDIESKVKSLETMAAKGFCNPDDVTEVKERLRTLYNLSMGGNNPAVFEVDESKGLEITVYRDGKPVKIKKRGKQKTPTSEAQKKAAENARKYAHTDEANKKRRKSISARSDGKVLGEI